DADQSLLRDHHRLLLRWLHPDRSGPDAQWESAMATRVNQAWNQLRTAPARAEYDATLPPEPVAPPAAQERRPALFVVPSPVAPRPGASAPIAAGPEPVPPPVEPPAPAASRLGPAAVAVLGLACAVL